MTLLKSAVSLTIVSCLAACSGDDSVTDPARKWEVAGPETAFALSFAFHPTDPRIVFIGADDGAGVWRSSDGGDSFELVSGEVPDVSGYALALDVANPDFVYAGCGSGRGVMRSTDGGHSWAPAQGGLDSFDRRVVIDLAIDPVNPATLFAATEGGLLRSDDRALTWQPVAAEGGPGAAPAWRVVVAGSTLFALLGSFNGPPAGSLLMASPDRGTTWLDLTDALRNAGATSDFNPDEVDVSGLGTIYVAGTILGKTAYFRSTDSGATFARLAPELDAVFGRLVVDPADDMRILVTGSIDLAQPLLVSDDQGDSFTVTGGAFDGSIPISLAVSPHAGNRVFFGAFGDLFRSDDRGVSFVRDNAGLTNAYANAVASGLSCVYAGIGAHNSTYGARNAFRFCNGGGAEELALPDDAYSIAADPTNDTVVIAGTLSTGVFHSEDAGATFAQATGFPTGPALALWLGSDGTALASGADAEFTSFGIFTSVDSGKSFANTFDGLVATRFLRAGGRFFCRRRRRCRGQRRQRYDLALAARTTESESVGAGRARRRRTGTASGHA